jgi:hypothetical protein
MAVLENLLNGPSESCMNLALSFSHQFARRFYELLTYVGTFYDFLAFSLLL